MIYRDEHRSRYTQISNSVFADKRISLAAKGLLCTMLAKPESWRFAISRLRSETNATEYTLRVAIRELEKAGYLENRGKTFNELGQFSGQDYVIFETPEVRERYTLEKAE